MASRNYEKRQRQKLRQKKAEARYVESLRRDVVHFEGVTARMASLMSKERLEIVIKRGKLRKWPLGAHVGIPLSVAAAALLAAPRR